MEGDEGIHFYTDCNNPDEEINSIHEINLGYAELSPEEKVIFTEDSFGVFFR